MNWGEILHILSILLGFFGTILLIKGVRNRFKKSYERTKLDFVNTGILTLFAVMFEDSMSRITKTDKSIKPLSLKDYIRLYFAFIWGIFFMQVASMEWTLYETLFRHGIKTGIIFISIGAIIHILIVLL